MTTYTYNQDWWERDKVKLLKIAFDVNEAVKRTLVGEMPVSSTPSLSGHYGSFFGASNKSPAAATPQHNPDTPKIKR